MPPTLPSPLGLFALLPPELRLLIWRLATHRVSLGNDLIWPDPRSTHGGAVRDRRHALAILRVSKPIFVEVVLVVYGGKRFLITLDLKTDVEMSASFDRYLGAQDNPPEEMPGPEGPEGPGSATGWWHLLGRVDISVVPPRCDSSEFALDRRERAWGLLGLRLKVVRLVDGLRSAQRLGLPEINVQACESLASGNTWFETTWSESAYDYDKYTGYAGRSRSQWFPERSLKDSPWTDIDIIFSEFRRLRGCRDAALHGPLDRSGYPAQFCFDLGIPLEKVMKAPPVELRADSYDVMLTSGIQAYCEKEMQYWRSQDFEPVDEYD